MYWFIYLYILKYFIVNSNTFDLRKIRNLKKNGNERIPVDINFYLYLKRKIKCLSKLVKRKVNVTYWNANSHIHDYNRWVWLQPVRWKNDINN